MFVKLSPHRDFFHKAILNKEASIIMVAKDETLSAHETTPQALKLVLVAKEHITEMIHGVIRFYHTVPVPYHGLVHVLNGVKTAATD